MTRNVFEPGQGAKERRLTGASGVKLKRLNPKLSRETHREILATLAKPNRRQRRQLAKLKS